SMAPKPSRPRHGPRGRACHVRPPSCVATTAVGVRKSCRPGASASPSSGVAKLAPTTSGTVASDHVRPPLTLFRVCPPGSSAHAVRPATCTRRTGRTVRTTTWRVRPPSSVAAIVPPKQGPPSLQNCQPVPSSPCCASRNAIALGTSVGRGGTACIRPMIALRGRGKVPAVPALADTTIRLLGQEPLAGRVPTAELLRLAEILDTAGFAYLEVSGGGCFDAAVKRGVESPWERIRAIKARTKTPLGLALRGKFLVGDRPVDNDFARRFVASAAANGIDVFRLHDPLNDVSNLSGAAEAIAEAGRELEAGLVYSAGRSGETDVLVEQARRLPELGASRVLLHDPTGALLPHQSYDLTERMVEATGLPVGIYCQGASGAALSTTLAAERAGADLLACTLFPLALTLHRVSAQVLAETLSGRGRDPGVDVQALWRASDIVDEHIGDEPVTPLAPRIAVRAAEHELPAGLVAGLDTHLRAYAAGDRLDDVIEELARIRAEVGGPPLAAPVGHMLASQALLHVLSAERW